MKKLVISVPLILIYFVSLAQIAPDKYFVAFTDKNNSPYSIDQPIEFLSQRAIDRRNKQGIDIDIKDLPVNPDYLAGVEQIGVTLLNPTKWLNGVTIETDDPSKIDLINNLPYVEYTVKSPLRVQDPDFEKPFFKHESGIPTNLKSLASTGSGASFDYGDAFNQIHMLRGDELHDMGYTGKGMLIAILDAGYNEVDAIAAFDSLWSNDRIIATWDFVNRGPITYDQHGHGTSVLSTIGANVPGVMVGTAPHASFLLLRSEDGSSEYIIEEYNWVSAAEYADSAGADIINSSLGYSEFDDASQDHTYQDMDGNTTPVTIGADVAASRGMIVVNSAGNEGNVPWTYLIAPSDGDSVVCVGAVDGEGNYASFSSLGPSSDGRVKPNVAAQGSGTWVAYPQGFFGPSGGTSFSSPITAGMMACIWQANRDLSNMDIISAVQQSASLYNNPNDSLGYGIPDYVAANDILTVIELKPALLEEKFTFYPNPFRDGINILFEKEKSGEYLIDIMDVYGRLIFSKVIFPSNKQVSLSGFQELPEGVYIIRLSRDGKSASKKLIKY
jgi:hypothetical protein